MKRVCKQCGTTFELSDSEIAFYKKKNLHLPKRCKECRQANRQGRAVQEARDWNGQRQNRDVPGMHENKVGKWVYGVIIVALLLLFGLTRFANQFFSSDNVGPIVSVGNGNASSTVSVEDGMSADLPVSVENSVAGEAPPDVKEMTQAESVDVTEPPQAEAANVEAVNAEEAAVLQDAAEAIPEETVGEEEAERQYTFRNSKLLNEHFEKHGKEMGFSSAEEYQAAASAVVNNANALHKTEKEDGDDVYYLEATNEFVIVSTDGFIRTYFLPNAGIDYYNRQ